jgi:hypothetical protein
LCLQTEKELHINQLELKIELKFNPVYTINIVIIYSGKKLNMIASIYKLLPSFTKFSNLLVFNSLVQILKFSDPMISLASLFGVPCPKKEEKHLFEAQLLEPHFLNFGGAGASLLGALNSLGPRAVWIPR